MVRETFTARGPACMAPAVVEVERVMEAGMGAPPAVRHGPLHRMERRSDPKGPPGGKAPSAEGEGRAVGEGLGRAGSGRW